MGCGLGGLCATASCRLLTFVFCFYCFCFEFLRFDFVYRCLSLADFGGFGCLGFLGFCCVCVVLILPLDFRGSALGFGFCL